MGVRQPVNQTRGRPICDAQDLHDAAHEMVATLACWMAGLNLNEFDADPVKVAAAIDADIYSTYYKEVTPQLVAQAHSLGMRVIPFTVNDPAQMRTMIGMGVDGLITDRPATLRQVMQELAMPVPPKDPDPSGKPYFSGTDGL